MSPLKLLSFALKASVAIFIHSYKIDILNIRAEKGSSLDSNISTFIVASCVACILSKVDLSQHFQSISNVLVFVLESVLTIYGTEVVMYLIWLPLLKGLLWMSTRIGKSFTKSRYKSLDDEMTNCIDSDLFCYLNICLALFIASNTLASFDGMKNLKKWWPSTLTTRENVSPAIPQKITNTMMPNVNPLLSNIKMTDPDSSTANVTQIRPKRKTILLMNVR